MSKSTRRFVISHGSNATDSADRVRRSFEWLMSNFDVKATSVIYQTEAVGGCNGVYSNAVSLIWTELTTEELDARLKEYETSQGRTQETRRLGEVPIDLDIVIADGNVLRPWEHAQSFFRKGYNQIKESDRVP